MATTAASAYAAAAAAAAADAKPKLNDDAKRNFRKT